MPDPDSDATVARSVQLRLLGTPDPPAKLLEQLKGQERLLLHHSASAVAGLYLPVPVRLEVCGLPTTALSATCNDPVLAPVAVGVKTTLIVQLVLAARLVVQVVVETLKSPVVEIVMPVKAAVCLLASVNTLAALVVPTFCAA